MGKSSFFERVVGKLSEDEKKEILDESREDFSNQIFEELDGKEREKTPEELQIISLVDEATNKVRQKYGLDDFSIPSKNIHIIKEEFWPREIKENALFSPSKQAIAIREQLANLVFMKKVFHELLHLKSYGALQVTKSDNPELCEYRVGLTMRTRDGEKVYFKNLTEAITEELTKKYSTALFNHSLFAEELEETEHIIKRYPNAVDRFGEPLFDEDVFYARFEDRDDLKRVSGDEPVVSEKVKKLLTESFSYQSERRVLNTLIDKIFERNRERFQNREEVFDVFAKAMMGGNIIPIGKLVDKTFGVGVLRKIADFEGKIEEQEEFVNSL